MVEQPKPFRWTERRAARFATMLISGAVVVADLFLLFAFIRSASNLPGGWKPYWYIPAAIVGVFFFAFARFRRHLSLFLRDE
jgi:hypothetical protein